MDVCLLWVLCVVRSRSLRWIDHSSRGVLPSVTRRCVWSRNFENEEAKARYRAVENTTKMGCNAKKTKKKEHSFYIVPNLITSRQIATESSVNIHLFHFVCVMYNKSKNIWYENLTCNTHMFASVVHSTSNMLLRYKVFEGVNSVSQPRFRKISLVVPKEIVK
jgi:hypothetical protein